MTNADFARDVLLLIGVIPEGMEATEEQCQTVLRAMNDLVDEWADSGVSVNWSPQSDSTDDFTLFGGEVSAAKYNLAVRLCPVYGKEPVGGLLLSAGQSYQRLLRNQLNREVQEIEVIQPQAEATRQWFDITSG